MTGSDSIGDAHGGIHRTDGDEALRDTRLAGVAHRRASPAADGGGDVVPIGDPEDDEGYGDEDEDEDEEEEDDDEES
ncbi:MAG: hypothetical protein ABI294_03750 [Casimicrobiaceae bacterium]